MLAVAIIVNNYLHDVATAVLLAAAAVMWALERQAEREGPALESLAHAYPLLTKFAVGAIAWIVLGGIPRAIFFTRYEWDPAVVKGIVPALAVKHLLMVLAIAAGAMLWRRVKRRIDDRAGTP